MLVGLSLSEKVVCRESERGWETEFPTVFSVIQKLSQSCLSVGVALIVDFEEHIQRYKLIFISRDCLASCRTKSSSDTLCSYKVRCDLGQGDNLGHEKLVGNTYGCESSSRRSTNDEAVEEAVIVCAT